MNFKSILFILLIPAFFGCKSKTAHTYSQWIVGKETSLLPDINKTENNVERFATAGNFDSIAIVSERMERLVDKRLQEIEDKPAPDLKEAENFKKASLRYFAFLESIYTRYKIFALKKTDEERDIERKTMIALMEEKPRVVLDMQEAQQKFAKANGFRIQQ